MKVVRDGGSYSLGVFRAGYAIWERNGTLVRTFPLSAKGWTAAWMRYEQLERRAMLLESFRQGMPPLVNVALGAIIGFGVYAAGAAIVRFLTRVDMTTAWRTITLLASCLSGALGWTMLIYVRGSLSTRLTLLAASLVLGLTATLVLGIRFSPGIT